MASAELIKAVNEYNSYIKRRGIDEDVINAYVQACQVAYLTEGDIEYGAKLSANAKWMQEKFCKTKTGGALWDLEKHAFKHKTWYDLLDKYYTVLLYEAQSGNFDSYMLYLEKKREPKQRFYMPKRKQFHKFGLIEAYQGMLDDKYDILCISQPPGTGKCQPLYSKVLTPDGFKCMGSIKVGDRAIAANGNVSTVLGVYPQGKKSVYEIELSNGAKCRCSNKHLWLAWRTDRRKPSVVEFSDIIADNPRKWLLPITNKWQGYIKYIKIKEIRYIGKEECQCIYIDDPCHLYITDDYVITHNTTLLKFFNSAVIGWFPRDYNLFYSHSSDITRMYYDGVYQMVSDNIEYTWKEIFPELQVTSTNAKMQQFNIGAYKPFPSLQTAAVGSENAGKVRASKFLLVDDMIGKLEEALNKNILEKLWGAYTVDARQRKTMDSENKPCKEIIQATRWSTMDPIGRLIKMYAGNERVKVIAIPDVDPVTGESNFDYEFGGFTKEFFADQALLMDDVSYKCLYKQEPIEREGLLFPEDKTRRYLALPSGAPEIIYGQCDTKGKGTDYFVLPVLQKYGDDYYCIDCVCSNSADYEMQYENAANVLVNNKVQDCEFERNAGGDRVAMEVNKRVVEKGWVCNITDVPTETNKEARIYQYSNWILQHVIFKDKSLYTPKEPYGVMMSLLHSYSVSSAKQVDDVPDCFSNFARRITASARVASVEAISNPFRYRK